MSEPRSVLIVLLGDSAVTNICCYSTCARSKCGRHAAEFEVADRIRQACAIALPARDGGFLRALASTGFGMCRTVALHITRLNRAKAR